jgi:hypothetical protein
MALKDAVSHLAARLFFERPARKLTIAEHKAELKRSGDAIQARLATVQSQHPYRERLQHVIGIERWGQRRLRVLLGEPFIQDTHQLYKPPANESWEKLVQGFARTRAETIALAGQLAERDSQGVVSHNQFGGLSARAWLRYLNGHATRELRKLK